MTIINSTIKGKQPVIDTLNVTPSTSAQTITATGGTDGYSPVNVSAVTSAIDANIAAGNIKSGVSILGVSGSVVELNGSTETVTPTTSQQTITPTSPSNGLTSVTVNAVTSAIDANIVAGNIKDGVSILGVTGNYQGTQPTGTMYIISNGTYNVADKAIANVQVPTTAPAHYIEKAVDANGKLIAGSTFIDLTGLTNVGDYVLCYAYYQNASITGAVDMSDLTTLSGSAACRGMFQGCTSITSVDLSSLTTISGTNSCQDMFKGCTGLTTIDLSSLTKIEPASNQTCVSDMFNGCTGLTSISLPSLTECKMDAMFKGCSGLTSINLPSLTTVSSHGLNSTFQGCSNLTSVNLSSIKQIWNGDYAFSSAFSGCTKLTNVDLSGLEYVSGHMPFSGAFRGCVNLTNVDLSSVIRVTGNYGFYGMFGECTSISNINFSSITNITSSPYGMFGQMFYTGQSSSPTISTLTTLAFPSLTSASFGSYNNQFNNMLYKVVGCTVHFPSNLQSVIGSWTSVTGGFGGTNTTVLFDLPATNTLTGTDTVTYTRNPKYDTQTALAWKVGVYGTSDFIPAYYTSGLTDPTVGTTIYSDAACTTAVTTVDSIA